MCDVKIVCGQGRERKLERLQGLEQTMISHTGYCLNTQHASLPRSLPPFTVRCCHYYNNTFGRSVVATSYLCACVYVCSLNCTWYLVHNCAIRPCHPSHSMPLALLVLLRGIKVSTILVTNVRACVYVRVYL